MFFTAVFPISLSFDRRVYYVRQWKWVMLSSILIAIPFLIWDQFFAMEGIWGFNPDYLTGPAFGHLPLEEIFFFFIVPFACTFIYQCCKYYFRNFDLTWFNRIFGILFIAFVFVVAFAGFGSWYTDLVTASAIIVLALTYRNIDRYRFIPLAFTFSMIPFLIVNGVLTGLMLDDPIVWYNHAHFSGLRIVTIPFEDILYSFSLIASNIVLFEFIRYSVKKHVKSPA